MITEALLGLIMFPFRAALALLPVVDPPDIDGLVSGAAPLWQFGGWLNNFVPLAECVSLLGVLLVAFAAVTAVRAVLYVLTKAHILGGAS